MTDSTSRFSRHSIPVTTPADPYASDHWTPAGWRLLQRSARCAGQLGAREIQLRHLWLALLSDPETPLEPWLPPLQNGASSRSEALAGELAKLFREGPPRREELPVQAGSCEAAVRDLLSDLQAVQDGEPVGREALLLGLLTCIPGQLQRQLAELGVDWEGLLQATLSAGEEDEEEEDRSIFPPPLAEILRLEDLTWAVRHEDAFEPAIGLAPQASPAMARLVRALHGRVVPHLLIVGDPGVGKSRLLEELVLLAEQGTTAHLRDLHFWRADTSQLAPEDSRGVLQGLKQYLPPATNLALFLEGLAELIRRPKGENNQALLRAFLTRTPVRVIGTLNRWEYQELIASDPRLDLLFTRIDLAEPDEVRAMEILQQRAEQLTVRAALSIPPATVQKTIQLTGQYLLCERFPGKAVRVLARACDQARYERDQHASSSTVEVRHVIRVLSEHTGIPEETLAGSGGEADLQTLLQQEIFGQQAVVEAVANELKLIQAGLTEPGKPASVLLFAGLTGVGKTELAKQIARLYSASRQLQVYTMGNFTEPHSVSGIIGVPPGYVGHDQGGRLINELNADPYCVFLLDEAEKAHPNVWKPFLNLFDEGWIVDQRGVKAYADRAIFILTTNAGDRSISQMAASGKSEEEIVEKVKQTLARIRPERGSQPVFTPQFLARLHRILVFQPLDEDAMIQIARRQVQQMQLLWERKREKQLIIPEEIIEHLGRQGHQLNQQAHGQEGGRILRKLIRDQIEAPIQRSAGENPQEYRESRQLRIVEEPSRPADLHLHVQVVFESHE